MKKQSTEIRQEQIKQAVLDIIYKDGLKNLSTRNLSKQIGMSEGAIFRHFTSKQDIILSIIKDVRQDFIGPLEIIANSDEMPEARLKSLLCFTIQYLMENKGITMLMFSEASHNNDADLKQTLLQIFNSQKSLVSKIIQDGITQGIWNNNISVENIAMLYMGIPVSLNIELILNGGNLQAENFCQNMLQLLLKILEK
ncbi:MAG: TetR/AcrR family transcriptional regulator [Bacteroidales bacterium]|nr:TetR/AcrR family transcriptional regulator [Bacteroidales bacterium]